MDLMNLTDELKHGKLIKQDEKFCELLTPVFRASFPTLVEAETFNGQGKPRFTLSAIFNIKNPAEPAHVDVTKILLPALQKVASASGLGFQQTNPITLGKRHKRDGSEVAGYDDWSAWCTMSKYPSVQRSFVPCYSATGKTIDASAILGGYYCRARIQPYKPKGWNTISLGLVSVQLLAEGETFGGEPTETEIDAVPGASDVPTGFDKSEATPAADMNTDFSDFTG